MGLAVAMTASAGSIWRTAPIINCSRWPGASPRIVNNMGYSQYLPRREGKSPQLLLEARAAITGGTRRSRPILPCWTAVEGIASGSRRRAMLIGLAFAASFNGQQLVTAMASDVLARSFGKRGIRARPANYPRPGRPIRSSSGCATKARRTPKRYFHLEIGAETGLAPKRLLDDRPHDFCCRADRRLAKVLRDRLD